MKIVEKTKHKKQNIKHKQIDKSKKDRVLVVAQEIKFARLLSANDTKTRDRLLKTLKKWLASCFQKGYDFKEEDFQRVWKGLFYSVWMSDKPLVQEELCENISGILDEFPVDKFKYAILMIKSGLRVLATEWFGIDQHRIDKFMMLVRRLLRGSLRCLKRSNWDLEHCKMYTDMLSNPDGILAVNVPHYARNATSMILHFIDCYLEELSKVSGGDIPDAAVVQLCSPLIQSMCGASAVCTRARRALTWLLRQSPLGLQYQEATRAWHKMGCPKGGPEALELVVEDDDSQDQGSGQESEDEEDLSPKPLDPRAGRVDVELNPLPVPAQQLAAALREQLRSASSKAYKRAKICMHRFERLSRQEYPLPLPRGDWDVRAGRAVSAHKAAASLATLHTQLTHSADELALRGLSRKHRKRILARSRAGVNVVEELERARQKQNQHNNTANDGWKVEETEPKPKKQKLNEAKKSKIKGEVVEKKRKHTSTEVVASKKHKTEDKNKKDVVTKEKVILNGVAEKKSIKGVTDVKKCKLQKDKKDITDKSQTKVAVVKAKEKSEKDKVNGISDKKQVKNAPKVIKDVPQKDSGDKVKPPIKLEKPKTMSVKTKVSLHKDIKTKDAGKKISKDSTGKPTLLVNKVKNFQKSAKKDAERKMSLSTPKKQLAAPGPRAGRVDVELNPLPVPAQQLAAALREQLRSASSKAYKRAKICMHRFERLSRQEYPLPLPRGDWDVRAGRAVSAHKAAASLATLHTQLTHSADELALRGLSRKHRKRILARSRAGVNVVEELERARQKQNQDNNTENDGWKVEETEPKPKKQKLNEAKKSKIKGEVVEKKRKHTSTEVVASKKHNIEDKNKKDVVKKEKVILNGVAEKKSIKGVTDVKKCKLQKDKKDITDKSQTKVAVVKPKEKSEKDKVNGISDKKQVKNAPKVIKDVPQKDSGDKVKPPIKLEKPKTMSVKTKVSLHKDIKTKDAGKKISKDSTGKPTLLVNKVKNFQKSAKKDAERKMSLSTPKKVKFVLKNNSMQGAVDYYKSVRQSPNIPYNPSKKPSKTNLKPSTPSPINPFFKKKLKLK